MLCLAMHLGIAFETSFWGQESGIRKLTSKYETINLQSSELELEG